MKIKVNEKISVSFEITQKSTTPSGNAYWQIDYMYQGICIHSATTGCISGNPNPIDMLDRIFEKTVYFYQDIPNPTPKPGVEEFGRKICAGTAGGRPAWWEISPITHRQAIIDAVAQIIED